MRQLALKKSKSGYYAGFCGDKAQELNLRVVLTINNYESTGLLKLRIRQDKAPVRFSAYAYGLVPLVSFLHESILRKALFEELLYRSIATVETVEKNHLDTNHLVYDIDFVFIDPETLTPYFVYIPVTPYRSIKNQSDFFIDIVRNATFDPSEDNSYIQTFVNMIEENSKVAKLIKSRYLAPAAAPEQQVKKLAVNENAYLENESKTRFFIGKTPFRIGKLAESSDLRINNSTISRNHAEIYAEPDGYYIVDLSSTNGTYVNGIRLEAGRKVPLKNGDSVRFSRIDMVFHK